MITKIQLQDMVLKNLQEHLQTDTIMFRQRIDKAFTDWFQNLVEKPKAPELGKDDKKEGGGGAGEQPPAPEGGGA